MDFSEFLNMGSLSNSELKGKSPSSSSSANSIAVDSKKNRKVFRSRWPNVRKKSTELTTLCDVEVAMVCNFEGIVYNLPGCEEKFQEIVKKYKRYDDDQKGKRKRGFDSSSIDDDGFVINKNSKNTSISKERFCPNFSEVSSMESLVEIGNRVESVLAVVNGALNRIHNEEQIVQIDYTTSSGFIDDSTVECTPYLTHSGGDYGVAIEEENQQMGLSYSSLLLSNDDDDFDDFINSAFDYDYQNQNQMINELLCA